MVPWGMVTYYGHGAFKMDTLFYAECLLNVCALTPLVPRPNLSPDDTFVQSHAGEKPFKIAGVVYKKRFSQRGSV